MVGTKYLLLSFLLILGTVGGRQKKGPYTETERLAEYEKRGHSWPIKEYIPNTEGWSRLMNRRLGQVQAMTNTQHKWDGWIQTLSAAVTVPNFTEFGWGLTAANQNLTQDLRQGIYEGLPNARSEGKIDVIDGPEPLFIDRKDLTKRALKELQPILEAWAGMELTPAMAYGFRLYRNESRLWMHVDKAQTHVISCIYHIASSDDAEPWPIVIEDYDGNTNAIVLTPGSVLLYESSKAFHGRPTKFNGSWYTSLFVHFYPKDPEWRRENHDLNSHYAVPPANTWRSVVPSDHPHVGMFGTSMMEPDCPDSWCLFQDAVKWESPGKYGEVMTGWGKTYSLGLDENGDGEDEEEL